MPCTDALKAVPMVLDTKQLKQKLAQLENYIQDVVALREKPKTEFKRRTETEDVAEHRLEKAIQCSLDIASMIVSQLALGTPTQYKDLFFYLGRAGILNPLLVERLEKMAGFRNLLIHEYSEIDTALVHKAVH